MSKWSKFDSVVDVNELNHDIEELGNGEFEDLPEGRYEVRLDSLEMKPTKEKGYPMLAACFTVIEGEYKKRKIFVNQVIVMGDENDKYRVRGANDLLIGLDSGLSIKFNGLDNYEKLINAVADKCEGEEYLLELGSNKKGYPTYKIVEHYTDDSGLM